MNIKLSILRLFVLLVLVLLPLRAQDDITQLPFDTDLPLPVRVAVKFIEVKDLNEVEGTFSAIVDVRLVWTDLRHRYAPKEAPNGFKEWRLKDAEKQMEAMYVPVLPITNVVKEPDIIAGLRIYPSGQIELMRRYTGTFEMSLDVAKFPFDTQQLSVELLARRLPNNKLLLTYEQSDLDFSELISCGLDAWTPGAVSFSKDTVLGWNGQKHSRVKVALEVARKPMSTMAVVFIPMAAVLLIPLIALWLQKQKEGEFEKDAMDIVNLLVGGLFAVIALNFAVITSYPALGTGDNPANRLFAICYLLLGVTFVISLLVFSYDLPRRWFGRYVSEQVFHFCNWGIPAITLTLSVSVLVMAAS